MGFCPSIIALGNGQYCIVHSFSLSGLVHGLILGIILGIFFSWIIDRILPNRKKIGQTIICKSFYLSKTISQSPDKKTEISYLLEIQRLVDGEIISFAFLKMTDYPSFESWEILPAKDISKRITVFWDPEQRDEPLKLIEYYPSSLAKFFTLNWRHPKVYNFYVATENVRFVTI